MEMEIAQPFAATMREVSRKFQNPSDDLAPVAVGRKLVSQASVSASDALDPVACVPPTVGSAKMLTSSAATISFPEILNRLFIVSSVELVFVRPGLERLRIRAELRGVLERIRHALRCGLVGEVTHPGSHHLPLFIAVLRLD
jgi:hypothetical protein